MTRRYLHTISVLLLLVLPFSLFAQKSEGGLPPSFEYPSALRSVSSTYDIDPQLDVKRLVWEDSIAERNGNALRIAIEIPVNIDIKNNGQWRTLPDSTRIWQQTISLKGATGAIISYDDFYIPQGGKLFIYNQEQTEILGAYTHETYPQGGRFATEPIYSETFTLEYVASNKSTEDPRIVVSGLGYMYRDFSCPSGDKCFPQINSATQACIKNINCIEGKDWQNQKRGLVLFFVKVLQNGKQAWGACTGSLVNNTNVDGKPYILTATHCFFGNAEFDQLIAYFNHEFSGCNNENTMPDYKSLVGAIPRVYVNLNSGSDTFLYELKDEIPNTWNPYYNGWDRRNSPASSGAVLQHPYYDVKKIALYNKAITSATWVDNPYVGATNAHWRVVYNDGVTDKGSSGSPLFNADGLIIGTLTGGSSSCASTSSPDMYGKLWYAWDQFTEDLDYDQQLKLYLDPLDKGVESLVGYDPNGTSGIEEEFDNNQQELILFPIPAVDELNINAASIIRKIDIYDMQGRLIFTRSDYSGSTANLDISTWATGIYTVKVNTEQKTLTEKFLKK